MNLLIFKISSLAKSQTGIFQLLTNDSLHYLLHKQNHCISKIKAQTNNKSGIIIPKLTKSHLLLTRYTDPKYTCID